LDIQGKRPIESAAQAIRIARFTIDGRIGIGRVEGYKVAPLGIATVAEALAAPSAAAAGAAIPISRVEFLPPIDEAAKIICVGFNYAGHVREVGGPAPQYPSLFIRTHDYLVGHGQKVIKPLAFDSYDFEGELGVMIGRHARHLAARAPMVSLPATCASPTIRSGTISCTPIKSRRARISTIVALPDPGLRSFRIRRRSPPRESSRA
jgi:hypothetical protein